MDYTWNNKNAKNLNKIATKKQNKLDVTVTEKSLNNSEDKQANLQPNSTQTT